jgi:hypothetical protein
MGEQCWCGVANPYYAPEPGGNCGGLGVLECLCGGDLCVCHHHGEILCGGCDDCESEDDDDVAWGTGGEFGELEWQRRNGEEGTS